MTDDLFTPTVRERPVSGKRPWRPESIFYAAFFGGPLTAGLLGVINGRRLGVPAPRVLLTALAGLAGFGAWIVSAATLVDANNAVRLVGSITGALAWLVVIAFQRAPFRAYTYGDGEPAKLFLPGLLTALGLGFFQAATILVVAR
ncbi:hypothetical protein [Actinoplanes sp. NBRC 103695]|uniref:hypothetical protein n=1 Tax=Actinoplanes sp. NBRC 103695 TaxID=3032202 RepID=UPI0024A26252|nr:hypothetical protein [Actinoplanes sp. NBRC 103695]GLZ00109.1 hypothetical protein Acsp02_73610 [Actinoplanes sp. NBRC 103695]